MFSLKVTFYLTKTENRTKRFITLLLKRFLTLLLWVKVLFWPENADIIKIEMALVLRGTFSETVYMFVLTCQIGSF